MLASLRVVVNAVMVGVPMKTKRLYSVVYADGCIRSVGTLFTIGGSLRVVMFSKLVVHEEVSRYRRKV